MTSWMLIRKSLRFHARSHVGVVLGAMIGSAALIGALVVGDSVRESLRQGALRRLANTSFALAPPGRTFSQGLESSFTFRGPQWTSGFSYRFSTSSVSVLTLPATASIPSGTARANHAVVYGVDKDFWRFAGTPESPNLQKGTVFLNHSLIRQLRVQKGDVIILRVNRPSAFSREAAVAPRGDQSVGLRLIVAGEVSADAGGDFDLRAGGQPPMNAFISLDELSAAAGLAGRANLCLSGPVLKVRRSPQGGPTGFAGYLMDARQYWYRFFYRRPYRPPARPASTEESVDQFAAALQRNWDLKDAELELEYAPAPFGLELRSSRVFLDPPIVQTVERIAGTNCVPILTYLANLITAGANTTPYSMVTAAGPPFTLPDMADDEIRLTGWLADDLGARPGDKIALVYFDPESGARLIERTNLFRVRDVVPAEAPWSDRTLMPEFPGIEKAESTSDWDAGFPLTYKIRPKDEQYWKQFRGTPKAFISLGAGQKMWGNRFGELTAMRLLDPPGMPTAEHWGRFKVELLAKLNPAELGFRFEAVRDQALKGAEQSQDFGQLFLGFSIFLVAAALLLMALLFQFALEQRVSEVGTLLALGFTGRQVRRLFLFEGAALALVGGLIGALGGLAYARTMLWGLNTVWRAAIGGSVLQFYAAPDTLIFGACASTFVACLVIWLALRKQARQPIRELLAGEVQRPTSKLQSRAVWVATGSIVGAAGIIGWAIFKKETANAEAFFSAGALLLVAGLAGAAVWLGRLARSTSVSRLTLAGLGVRGSTRRRKRSLATVALLASGCFVIVAVAAFRLDANQDAANKTSGNGGFALIGEAAIPVVQDLNSRSGREALGLNTNELGGVNVVPLRVRDGDEASCLNLNRAQTPRLLGVRPESLEGRFTFSGVAKGCDIRQGWRLLANGAKKAEERVNSTANTASSSRQSASSPVEIPAIGDANSIQWALGKKVGDTLDYVDEHGNSFKLRLVGAVANSILQGNLVIDEAEFVKRFPGESGYRMFLLDIPTNRMAQVSAALSRALQDSGLELTPAVGRLNAFNAVQNTYLGTFQILGGLGLLLGSAGLGVVVLRNVLERRGELGLLAAVGFRREVLRRLVLAEHGALLALGLGIGVVAAAIAVLPALLSPGGQLPYVSLALTLGAVLLNGVLWAWAAIRYALRGNLLEALRNE